MVMASSVTTESGVEGDGAIGYDSDTQVSSSDNMEEFASLSFEGVKNAVGDFSGMTSSVDSELNCCSRVVAGIGIMYDE